MDMPEEWTAKSIKFVCLKTEQWIPSKDKRDSFHYIDVSSVSNSTFTIKDTSLVEADAAPGRARKIVKWQDTIFATIRPSLKRVAFIPQKYDNQIASTAFCVIRPNQKQVTPLYVYYFLLSDFLNGKIAGLQHGASYPAVTDKDVLNQTIFLPPLAEQQKIAAVLYKIQRAIEIQESIIGKIRELKKSTLHHVFTHGLHGEKTKETEIGPIPEGWVLNRINNLVSETSQTDPSKAPDRKIKYIDVSSISNTQYIIETWGYHLGKDAPSRARKVVEEGDVIVATVRPTLRRIAYVTPKFNSEICSTAFCVLRPKRNVINQKYLYYVIQRDEFFAGLDKLQQGASYPAVADSDVKDQLIPLPSIAEQNEIANCFQVIDQKIELHAAKRAALQDLFKTMLNKLMTGEIRVKDLDVDVSEVSA